MASGSTEKSRILCIDYGTKRTGLAVSGPLGITAQGLETFETGGSVTLLDHIGAIIKEYGVSVVVLGMPLAMSGAEIEGSDRSRALAGEIEEKYAITVLLRDERMTSLEAERVLKQQGRIKKAGDIDRLSAVILLQNYLDESTG